MLRISECSSNKSCVHSLFMSMSRGVVQVPKPIHNMKLSSHHTPQYVPWHVPDCWPSNVSSSACSASQSVHPMNSSVNRLELFMSGGVVQVPKPIHHTNSRSHHTPQYVPWHVPHCWPSNVSSSACSASQSVHPIKAVSTVCLCPCRGGSCKYLSPSTI